VGGVDGMLMGVIRTDMIILQMVSEGDSILAMADWMTLNKALREGSSLAMSAWSASMSLARVAMRDWMV